MGIFENVTRRALVAAVAAAVCFFAGVAAAVEVQVISGNDSNSPGELRSLVRTGISGNNDTITFRSDVDTVEIRETDPINIGGRANLSITGNTAADGSPLTKITAADKRINPIIFGNSTGPGLKLANLHFTDIRVNHAGGFITNGSLINVDYYASPVSIGNMTNVWFSNNTSGYDTFLEGGGLVKVRSGVASATMGNIGGGGSFRNNGVTTGSYLQGGGLVGVWSDSGTATMGDIELGAAFQNNAVATGDYFQGGGLVGVWSDSGTATMGGIESGAAFQNNAVATGDYFQGGGLVGARSNSGDATMGGIDSTVSFQDNEVTTNLNSLEGGGLVGAFSASGSASVGGVGGVYTNSTVKTISSAGKIYGGGLVGAAVGADTGGNATVGNILTGSVFGGEDGKGNTVESASTFQGGGLVGARSNSGTATMGDIESGAAFQNNAVTTGDYLQGGGLVGARSASETATMGNIESGVSFQSNSVSTESYQQGGGLVGARSDSGDAKIGNIGSTVSFQDNEVTTNLNSLEGGGLVGAFSASGSASVGGVGGLYTNSTVKTSSTSANIYGGGLVGAAVGAATGGNATVGNILAGSVFGGEDGKGNTVESAYILLGGGLVGARSSSGIATMGDIESGAFFQDNEVTSARSFQGGGLVGASTQSGSALVGDVGGVYIGSTVKTNSSVYGGGLVGASVYTDAGEAKVGDILSGSVFGDAVKKNRVEISTTFYGGGLVGSYSALGAATMGDIKADVSFQGNEIAAEDFFRGGGLVGANTAGDATIGSVESGVSFQNNKVTGSLAWGGGLVGARSESSGTATIGAIAPGAFFQNNEVTVESELYGGGLVGTSSESGSASVGATGGIGGSYTGSSVKTLDSISWIYGGGLVGASVTSSGGNATVGNVRADSVFGGAGTSKNIVETANALDGGGLVGAQSRSGAATVGTIESNVSFQGNEVTAGSVLDGGGLVGAQSNSGDATVGDIASGVSMQGNVVTAGLALVGGGLVGATTSSGPAKIGNISSGAIFHNNKVTAIDSTLEGGGLVGAMAESGTAAIGTVAGEFSNNEVTAGYFLTGGGVLGGYTRDSAYTVSLGNVAGASFTGNTIVVGDKAGAGRGWALGGVIGASGLDDAWTITDTAITGNSLTVSNHNAAVTAGTIYVGTDRDTNNGSHAVTVDGDTVISGNSITYSDGMTRMNSFHFGRGWDMLTDAGMFDSLADASLTLAPGAGQTVELLDPISVDMNNGKAFTYTVGGTAGGTVVLGGLNLLDAAGGSAFTASSGTLHLTNDFSMTAGSPALDGSSNGGTLTVNLDNTSGNLSLILDLDGRDTTLAMFDSPDSFGVTGGNIGATVNVSVSGRTFSPTAVSEAWLVTNNRQSVDENNFTISDPDSNMTFVTDGDNLFITGTFIAPDSVSNSRNPNVRSSFDSGSLNDAWQAAKAGMTPADADAMFDRIAANTDPLTAEVFATRALSALDSANGMWQSVRGLAGLEAPGGWRRDAADGATDVASAAATASLACPASRRFAAFAGYFGSRYDQNGRSGVHGYDGRLHGFAVGGTYIFSPAWRGGLYFAHGRDKTDFDRLGAKNTAKGWQAGGFVEARPTARWGVRADLSHTWFDNDLRHDTPAGRYAADFDQRIFGLGVETGYDFWSCDGRARLTPFASLRWQHLSQDRVAENARGGAPEDLASRFDAQSADSLTGSLGIEVIRDILLAGGRRLQPSLRAAWTHEFADARVTGHGAYGTGGGVLGGYRVVSVKKGRDSLDLSAHLTARVHESAGSAVDLTAGVDASFRSRYAGYGFQVGMSVGF